MYMEIITNRTISNRNNNNNHNNNKNKNEKGFVVN